MNPFIGFLLLWPACLAAEQSQETFKTCTVSAARFGQNATLTCEFRLDFWTDKKDIHVAKMDSFNNDAPVLDCFWRDNISCDTKEGYLLQSINNRTAIIVILNATDRQEGTYMCQVVGDTKFPSEGCNFTLGGRREPAQKPATDRVTTKGETGSPQQGTQKEGTGQSSEAAKESSGGNIGGIVGGVVGFVLLVTAVAIILIWRLRKNRKTPPNSAAGRSAMDSEEDPLTAAPSGQNTNPSSLTEEDAPTKDLIAKRKKFFESKASSSKTENAAAATPGKRIMASSVAEKHTPPTDLVTRQEGYSELGVSPSTTSNDTASSSSGNVVTSPEKSERSVDAAGSQGVTDINHGPDSSRSSLEQPVEQASAKRNGADTEGIEVSKPPRETDRAKGLNSSESFSAEGGAGSPKSVAARINNFEAATRRPPGYHWGKK